MSVCCPKCKGTAVLEYYHLIQENKRVPYKLIRCTEAGDWHGSGFTNCKTTPEEVTQEEMDAWEVERRKPKPQRDLAAKSVLGLMNKGCGRTLKRGGGKARA